LQTMVMAKFVGGGGFESKVGDAGFA